jgi:hypothetical protein
MNEIKLNELKEVFPEININNLILANLIINKELDSSLLDSFKSNEQWIKQCFNRPSDQELEMNALNELLDGHGVEAIKLENAYVNRYWDDCIATYVNMGDTYITTILYDTMNELYRLTSWGDFYESAENIKDYFS